MRSLREADILHHNRRGAVLLTLLNNDIKLLESVMFRKRMCCHRYRDHFAARFLLSGINLINQRTSTRILLYFV